MSAPPQQEHTNGNSVDWANALATHGSWLRTVVFARLGNVQAVDDVMQEVSVAAVKQQAPLVDPAKMPGWLYRVAVTQALLYRRRHRRETRRVLRYAEAERHGHAQTNAGNPLEWLMADERQQLIRLALGRLSNKDREILLLKYTQGWSYRDLAGHLDLSHSAVESRLHRARLRLREELAELNVIEAAP